jgi:dTDP-4-amino-4,6-dideoxygalactose transaminase
VQTDLRDRLAVHMRDRGIYTSFRYWPLHRTSMYRAEPTCFPGAEVAAASTLLLPLHQGLSHQHHAEVLDALTRFTP